MDEGPHRDGTPSKRGNRSPSRRKNKQQDAESASSSSISEDVGQGSAADGLIKYKSATPLQFSSKSKMEVAQHALESGGDGKTDKPESWVSHYIEREPGGQYIKLGVVIETKIRLDPHLPFGAQNIQFPGSPNMQFFAVPPVPPDRRSTSSGTSTNDVRDAHAQGRGAQLSDVSDEKYSDESGRDTRDHHEVLNDHHHPPLDNYLHHERQDHKDHHKHGEEDFLHYGHQDHRDHHKHGEEEYIEEHHVGREEHHVGRKEHEDHPQRHEDRYEEIKGDPAPLQQHYPQEPESRRSSSGSDRSPRRKRGDSRGHEAADHAPPPYYYGHHGEPGGEHGRGMGITERGIPLGSHGLPLPPSSARRRSSWALGEIPLSSLAAPPPRSAQHHRRRSSVMPHEVIRER